MNFIKKSPWILHYDGSSCNGCDIEVLACLTPLYDVERFGIINTGNPKHADILLITGSVDKVLPVDVYVPGCAARPEAIIDGVVKGLAVLEEKQKTARKRKVAGGN
jgi:ech hydrogenase subunit C